MAGTGVMKRESSIGRIIGCNLVGRGGGIMCVNRIGLLSNVFGRKLNIMRLHINPGKRIESLLEGGY